METKLITANTWFANLNSRHPTRRTNFATFRRAILARTFQRFRIPETGFDDKSFPVKAFVNKGTWLVVCPQCGGAEYAWEEGWFFCCSCKNSYMGHKFRRLVFPTDRQAIEDALVKRPLANRNWTPTEAVADLEHENDEHAAELLPAAKGG